MCHRASLGAVSELFLELTIRIKTSKVLHDKMVDQLKESERLLARCATTPKWWTQIRNMFKGSNKERLIDQSNKLKDLMIQIQFKISTCSGQDPLAQPQGKGYDDLKRSQPEFCGDGQGAKPNGLEYTRIIKKIRTNDENLNPNDRRVDVNELPTIPLDINMLPTIIHDGGEGDGTSMVNFCRPLKRSKFLPIEIGFRAGF